VSGKPNLLLLTHRAPYPPDRGDRIRTYHVLRSLSERYNVYLGALLDEPATSETRITLRCLTAGMFLAPLGKRSRWISAACSLARGGSATEGLFASSALRRQVQDWARTIRFDAVMAYCSSMVQFTDLPELADVPLIVDLIDVDSQKWFDYAAAAGGLKRWLFALEGRRVSLLERALTRRAAAIVLVSEAEAAVLRTSCPNNKTIAVANGVDLDYFTDHFPVAEPRDNQCVFVGVLDYRANVESLVWFCREVWPHVVAQKPDAQFAIVGKNPAPAVKQLDSQPGVRLVGPVPDVRPYVAQSRFSVAPLQIARGIQNKVLEAMAMARPVVASPQALEGLAIEPDRDALAAATPDEWARAMLRLYSDDRLAADLGATGRAFVVANHAWTACLAPLADVLGFGASSTPSTRALLSREPAVCLPV
jgi:sugar transferase (PEP-CTERM/EpsH1 system associated)